MNKLDQWQIVKLIKEDTRKYSEAWAKMERLSAKATVGAKIAQDQAASAAIDVAEDLRVHLDDFLYILGVEK